MKKLTIIIATILLAVNLLAGLLLSAYEPFNICFTSIVIIATTILICLLDTIRLKTAFAISLSGLFLVGGLAGFILGCVSPSQIQDNGCIIAAALGFAVEIAILLICNFTSKRIE